MPACHSTTLSVWLILMVGRLMAGKGGKLATATGHSLTAMMITHWQLYWNWSITINLFVLILPIISEHKVCIFCSLCLKWLIHDNRLCCCGDHYQFTIWTQCALCLCVCTCLIHCRVHSGRLDDSLHQRRLTRRRVASACQLGVH